jgi:hypothetical protein
VLLVVEAGRAGRGRLAQLGQQRCALDRAAREAEVEQRALAHHRRRRAVRAQPAGERDAVEPRRVGMRPRVVGVDGRRQRAERRLEPVGGRALGGGEPLAAAHALVQRRRPLARLVDVAAFDGQGELLRQPQVRPLERPRDLAAELHAAPVGQVDMLDAPADPVARLEDEHVGATAA